jgi:hypothetical protein
MSAPLFALPPTTATVRVFMFASDRWRLTSCDADKCSPAGRFSADMIGIMAEAGIEDDYREIQDEDLRVLASRAPLSKIRNVLNTHVKSLSNHILTKY